MANQKVNLLGDINNMIKVQQEENKVFQQNKKGDIPVSDEKTEEPKPIPAKPVGRPKKNYKITRDKPMNILLDAETHKELGFLKLEYGIEMRDTIYVVLRKFLNENFQNRVLSKEGKDIIEKGLKDLRSI